MRIYRALALPIAIYTALVAVRLAFPQYGQLITFIAFYITLGQSANIFIGFTGYVDFGYSAFLALGMYGMAYAITEAASLGIQPTLVIPMGMALGALMATAVALAVGGVALRLRGVYFAIATIGVNEGLKFLIMGTGIFRGSEGLIVAAPLIRLFGSESASYISIALADYMIMALMILSGVATLAMIRSRLGYGLRALREDEDAAKVMGVNTTLYKVAAFVISSILAGLLGAAWSLKLSAIYPIESFTVFYVIEALAIVILGGMGSFTGPLIGGLLYAFLKYYFTTIFPGLQLLLLAPLILVIITLYPQGIAGFLRTRLARGGWIG